MNVDETKATASESAAGWQTLADEAVRFAEYEESRGRHGGVYRNKADTYAKRAEADRTEAADGVYRCSCCMKTEAERKKTL